MANEEHLAILRQGVIAWNKWKEANPGVKPHLSGANLSGASLRLADLSYANLNGADLRYAALSQANLSGADLRGVNLKDAKLVGANLSGADLRNVDLSNANLSEATLIKAAFSDANLRGSNLRGGNLAGADLTYTNLAGADLKGANLSTVQAFSANFEGATLTGALIKDWGINTDTNLKNVVCGYVYLKWSKDGKHWSERRPSDPTKTFAPSEFTKLFQKAQETVDLIFRNGVDWQALLISLDKLRIEADGAEFPIQAIENKDDGDFVVRLKTPPEANKAEVEKFVRQEYQTQLQLLESRYEERLQLQGEQLEFYRQQVVDYRHQNTNLIELAKLAASRPINVEANAVSNSQSSGDTYNGPIKATNFAPHGTAIGGTFNDYSQTITNNLDEIGQLITTLRSQAEQFPPDARNEVLEHLNDLQEDLKHPDQVKPSRLKATFAALLAIAVGVATATDFTNNVLELGKKFGVELVHPQGTQSAQSPQAPHSQDTPTVDVKRLEGGH